MVKLVSHFKKYTFVIIMIIGLLFIRANADLALPEYMSRIVNNGIQQKGIVYAVPEAIRESEFNKLLLFLNDDEKEEVIRNYTLIEANSNRTNEYLDKYPIVQSENIYILNNNTENILNDLNEILPKVELVVMGIDSGEIPGLDPDIDPYLMISNMTEEEITTMKEELLATLSQMPDSFITQAAVLYIEREYEAIGISVEDIQKNYILTSGFWMIIIALISMAAAVSVGYLAARTSTGYSRKLRKSIFEKVESFTNVEFDKVGASSLITRTTNDVQQIQSLVNMLLQIVFFAPVLGIGGILKVLETDRSMTWIIGYAVLIISIIVIILVSIVIPKFQKVQKFLDKLNLVIRESLTGILVIRAFNTGKHEEKRFNKSNIDLTKTNLFISRTMALMMPLMMLIMNGVTILIVWVGAHQIDAGAIQVGDMMAFIQYTMQIIMAFLMITMISIMLPRSTVSMVRIAEVLNMEPAIKDPKNPVKFNEDIKGHLEFKSVSFKYPGAKEYVIKDINFDAKPGEVVAFIGSTGSGKSTIVNLIPRFYDVTEGEILIDGVNVKDVTQFDLREKIGYVPQKGLLFSGTIDSNLRYGKEDATKEEITRAVNIAQATNFIETRDDKYQTAISQAGTNVSGGQKQRLSIARAIVKNPEIYIFDDSFSALDFKTDAALRQELKKHIKNSTVIIVAQRISTIMSADKIIVLDSGKMVGYGTHDELIKNNKIYKEIAYSQLSKEELEDE